MKDDFLKFTHREMTTFVFFLTWLCPYILLREWTASSLLPAAGSWGPAGIHLEDKSLKVQQHEIICFSVVLWRTETFALCEERVVQLVFSTILVF